MRAINEIGAQISIHVGLSVYAEQGNVDSCHTVNLQHPETKSVGQLEKISCSHNSPDCARF